VDVSARILPTGAAKPPALPEAALQIVALQEEEAEAEGMLDALKSFREPWERFVLVVRPIIQESAGHPWPIDDPQLRPRVQQADYDRLRLREQSGALFSTYSGITDPLGQLLRLSFLQPHDGLYTLIGKRTGNSISHEVDPDRFEWAIQESGSILNEQERRLVAQRERAHRHAEALQKQLDDGRAHELERLEREHWSFKGLWKRLTKNPLGKFLTWSVVTVAGAILAFYVVPVIVGRIAGFVAWIRSLL